VRSSALPLPLLCDAALFALRSRTLHVLERSSLAYHPYCSLQPDDALARVCAALCTMASMSKPSKPSETHGGAPPPTWSSERWCARNPSYAVPNYQTTSTELIKLAGKQFKRKQACGAYGAGRLETVTTVPHEDLIPCEAVIVLFEAYAPRVSASPIRGLLACRPRDLHS
jgi:hypothetical protein